MNLVLYSKSISYEVLGEYNYMKESLIMINWIAKKIVLSDKYKEIN